MSPLLGPGGAPTSDAGASRRAGWTPRRRIRCAVDITDVRTPEPTRSSPTGPRADPFKVGERHVRIRPMRPASRASTSSARAPRCSPLPTGRASPTSKTRVARSRRRGWDLLDYPEKKRKWKVEGGWFDRVTSTCLSFHRPAAESCSRLRWAPKHFKGQASQTSPVRHGVPDLLAKRAGAGLDPLAGKRRRGFRAQRAMIEWSRGPATGQDGRWIAGREHLGDAKPSRPWRGPLL